MAGSNHVCYANESKLAYTHTNVMIHENFKMIGTSVQALDCFTDLYNVITEIQDGRQRSCFCEESCKNQFFLSTCRDQPP